MASAITQTLGSAASALAQQPQADTRAQQTQQQAPADLALRAAQAAAVTSIKYVQDKERAVSNSRIDAKYASQDNKPKKDEEPGSEPEIKKKKRGRFDEVDVVA